MNCKNFETLLNEVLDQRESPAEKEVLGRHASECPPCAELLEIYTAMGQGSKNQARIAETASAKTIPGYVVAAVAATMLAILLGPISEFFPRQHQSLNLAHADPQSVRDSMPLPKSKPWVKQPVDVREGVEREPADPWGHAARQLVELRRLSFRVTASLVLPAEFSLMRTPDLLEMGESLNSVWKSIQGEPYLLPLLKQGVFFWMP